MREETYDKFHLVLRDEQTGLEYGFIFIDSSGNKNELAISRQGEPSTSLKTMQGSPTYDDFEAPFAPEDQDDWSGGRANTHFEKARNRFYDSYRATTHVSGQIVCGGQETYALGLRNQDFILPGSVSWMALYGSTRHVDRSFAASASYNADKAEFWIRKVGTPAAGLTVSLYNVDRSSTLKSITLDAADLPGDVVSVFQVFDWATTQALVSGTTYRIAIAAAAADDDENHWEVAMNPDAAGTTEVSNDAASWTAATEGLYYRVTDQDASVVAMFFEYKGQLYVATRPDNGTAGKVYMNGYRGAADTNSGDKTKLNDATQTGWASDEVADCIARIIDGMGVQEEQPWRKITASASGVATCDDTWSITHLGSGQDITQYVVLASDRFTLQQTGDYPFTDVAIADNIVYLACGEGQAATNIRNIRKLEEHAEGELWDKQFGSEDQQATFLMAENDPYLGPVLWLARNNDNAEGNTTLTRAYAPHSFDDGILAARPYRSNSDEFMEEANISDVSADYKGGNKTVFTIDADFTTGLIGSDSVDVEDWRRFTKIEISIKSSVTLAAGDLQLCIDDAALCGAPFFVVDFPAIQKNISYGPGGDYTMELDLDLIELEEAEEVRSVGINLATEQEDDVTITLQFHNLIPEEQSVKIGTGYEKITGIELYGEPAVPHVLTETMVYEVRNMVPQPIPLAEMKAVKSELNGRAHCTFDTYLVWSMLYGLERYYRSTLQDFGPNRDAGLPADRMGPVYKLLAFPGHIVACVDGGDDNISSVLVYRNGGWHELYRAPRAGLRIRDAFVQPIPGSELPDRLWISMGGDILWVPLAISNFNSYYDAAYRFTHESVVVTSWFYMSMRDVPKLWDSIKLFSENLSPGSRYVKVEYQLDDANDDDAWTAITDDFDVSPIQEIPITDDYSAKGRRMRYRLRLLTDDNSQTPRVLASLLEIIGRIRKKSTYPFTFQLIDRGKSLVNSGKTQDYDDITEWFDDLRELESNLTVLKVAYSTYKPLRDRYVLFEFADDRPIDVSKTEDRNTLLGRGVLIQLDES